MNILPRFSLLIPAVLGACALPAAVVPQAQPSAQTAAESTETVATVPRPEPLPSPEADAGERIAALERQVEMQQQQLEELHRQIKQWEQKDKDQKDKEKDKEKDGKDKETAAPPPRKTHRNAPSAARQAAVQAAPARDNSWERAQQQFRQGQYQSVLATLRGADNGGDGSPQAARRMYLLLQSHQRLNNCQSVIHIGQRYAGLFAASPQAGEALYAVGQCQWNIQQQDIARDTWRRLIRTYPDSAAARRAAEKVRR